MAEARPARSDRDLQDAVITYLSDADARQGAAPLPLSPEQAKRAGKFARFLARRYYRDRLARSFRYSRRSGAAAEALVDTPDFELFLDSCVLGALAAAERVGELAISYLNHSAGQAPWWQELLEYERAFFVQAATTENVPSGAFPRHSPSARCRKFSWDLPHLLRRLKAGEAIGDDLRCEVTLLFSRTAHGRIYVLEVDTSTAAIFHAADGRRDAAAIAQNSSLPLPFAQQTLAALHQVGALTSSSQE